MQDPEPPDALRPSTRAERDAFRALVASHYRNAFELLGDEPPGPAAVRPPAGWPDAIWHLRRAQILEAMQRLDRADRLDSRDERIAVAAEVVAERWRVCDARTLVGEHHPEVANALDDLVRAVRGG